MASYKKAIDIFVDMKMDYDVETIYEFVIDLFDKPKFQITDDVNKEIRRRQKDKPIL